MSLPTAGLAKDGDKRVAGTCTKSSSAKLKLSHENGRIEVEFEVDQNRAGVRWAIILRRNGSVVVRTRRVTKAPSGSFEARMLAGGGARAVFTAGGTSPTGEVCRAQTSF